MQYIKLFLLVFIWASFISCCKLPFFDCMPRTTQILVKPDVIKFEGGHIRDCTIKSWLLTSKNNNSDRCTLDIEMNLLCDAFFNLNDIKPINVFQKNNYLAVGERKFIIDPTEIKVNIKPSIENSSFSKLQFYFSFLVSKKEITDVLKRKSLELNQLYFPDDSISVVADLKF